MTTIFNALLETPEWLFMTFMEKIYDVFNLFSCLKSEVLSKNHSRKDLVYIQALEGI